MDRFYKAGETGEALKLVVSKVLQLNTLTRMWEIPKPGTETVI
jgi:hypothetical protein